MESNNLFLVLKGLLSEYEVSQANVSKIKALLTDTDHILHYAEFGLGIDINERQAKSISEVGLQWVDNQLDDGNEWGAHQDEVARLLYEKLEKTESDVSFNDQLLGSPSALESAL